MSARSLVALLLPALVPSVLAQRPAPGGGPHPVLDLTWVDDIGPLVHRVCSTCHRPGQAAPFPLLTYRDVQKRGPMIASVVEDRLMPPWHPAEDGPRFRDVRRLEDADLDMLVRWLDGGMPEGVGELVPPTFPDGFQLGEPDLVVEMAGSFEVPAGGPDIYRNFVIPLGFAEDRYVTAIELQPTSRTTVHHVLYHLDESGEARRRDGQDGRAGFSGMAGVDRREAFGGWAVGQSARHLPEGFAVKVPAGADLVLSTHFHPSGKVEREKTRVALHFADEPPERTFQMFMLPPLYGALSGIDIPPGDSEYQLEDTFVLPVAVEIHHVWAHAHMLCSVVEADATRPDGAVVPLLQIPRWDFNWQERYELAEPVVLEAGTRVRVRIVYDNSTSNPSNPFDPPQRVRFGRETTDEMGAVVFGGALAREGDLPELSRALTAHARGVATAAAANRPGRANARLLDGLRRLDRDGDGVVQLRDVPPRYRDLFRTLDADGDGRLRIEDIERRES